MFIQTESEVKKVIHSITSTWLQSPQRNDEKWFDTDSQ